MIIDSHVHLCEPPQSQEKLKIKLADGKVLEPDVMQMDASIDLRNRMQLQSLQTQLIHCSSWGNCCENDPSPPTPSEPSMAPDHII